MKTLNVSRYATDTTAGYTLSYLTVGRLKLHGIEPAWLDNRPNISCIPAGVYALLPYRSAKHRTALQILGGTVGDAKRHLDPPVVTRYRCLVHIENYPRRLLGCLAPGLALQMDGDPKTGGPALWNSRIALSKLIAALGDGPAQMIVRWEKGDTS